MRKEREAEAFALAREGSDRKFGHPNWRLAAIIGCSMAAAGCDAGSTSSSVGIGDDGEISEVPYDFDSDGPVVAKLRVTVPETDHMLLRGTMPVPKGMVLGEGGQVPFAVISPPDPTAAITQVETVTRYPDAADGADVVEITAWVRRPSSAAPGTQLDYQVVYSPHEPEPFEPSPAIENLLAAPGALRLVAHDPFGHRYETDLLKDAQDDSDGVEWTRDGSVVREMRIPTALEPVSTVEGTNGTLPRMMGVNAFLRTFRNQDFFALDLHLHNAFDGKDHTVEWDTAIDDLYFRDLTLRLPQGWTVLHAYENVFSGPGEASGSMQEVPIVGAQANGKMHLMQRQSQFSRRLVIAREGAIDMARVELEHGNLGFCQPGNNAEGAPLWSWWNVETPRFLPQNHVLPDLTGMTTSAAIDAEHAARFGTLKAQVNSGAPGGYPTTSGSLGWSHPYGVAYGGMAGGERIDQIPGVDVAWAASQNGYRYSELRAKMVLERQPFALVSSSGNPTRYEDHLNPTGNHGPWIPYDMMMTFVGDVSYFFGNVPTFQSDYVQANGLEPDYAQALRSYQAIDLQHLTRYTTDLMTMMWLGNDSLAKLQMRQCGELFRMTHHNALVGNWNYVGGLSMRLRQNTIAAHPASGIDYGRGEGWGLFATTAAYAAGDDELRERLRPWLAEVADTVRAGQSECTGNISAYRIMNHGQGRYKTRQSFELSFLVNALESMRTTVFLDVDESVTETLISSIVDAAYSTVQMPFWDPTFGGHMKLVGVGQADQSEPDFCHNLPADANYGGITVDHETPMTVWTFAYQLTGDGVFLQRPASAIGATSNLEVELLQLGPQKLPHSALLLGLVQNMPADN